MSFSSRFKKAIDVLKKANELDDEDIRRLMEWQDDIELEFDSHCEQAIKDTKGLYIEMEAGFEELKILIMDFYLYQC